MSGPQGVLSLSFPAGGGAALLEAEGAPRPCSVQVDTDQRRPWVVRESVQLQPNSTEFPGEAGAREEGLRCMMSCIDRDTAL